MITENFDTPPAHWVGVGNTTAPQDFGWKSTHFAGGYDAGEVGGLFNSELAPSSYSTSIGTINPRTTRLRMTGTGRFTGGGINSAFCFIGWYNSNSNMDYPAPGSSIGFFADTDGGTVEDGLRLSFKGGSANYWEFISRTLGMEDSYTFIIDWDPTANSGNGRLTGTTIGADGFHHLEYNLPAGYKNQLTNFDRFGLVSTRQVVEYYRTQTMYWDDISYTSNIPKPSANYIRTQNFDTNPSDWVGWNNRTGLNDFGWSNTNNVGLGAGEAGGYLARDGNTPDFAYYATEIGNIDPSDESFSFSGTLKFKNPSSDFFMIGFFTPEDGVGTHDGHPNNFMGLYSDDRYTSALWLADNSAWQIPATQIGRFDLDTQVPFQFTYDAYANNGYGAISGSVGGVPFSYNLASNYNFKDDFHNFTHFGIVTRNAHGGDTIFGRRTLTYVDNLTYTSEIPEPVAPVLVGDYNENGVVDAADYSIWRENLNTSNPLPNRDPSLTGLIGQQDYAVWRSQFGNTGQGPSATSNALSIPEPASCTLLIGGWATACFVRRHRSRQHSTRVHG